MCGIVGYIGKEQAAPIVLDGLARLEYRGYDSAGLAVYDGERIVTRKAIGRLKVLENLTRGGETLPGRAGSAIPDGPPTERPATETRTLIPTRQEPSPSYTTGLLRTILR